jgi:hypothetical protein
MVSFLPVVIFLTCCCNTISFTFLQGQKPHGSLLRLENPEAMPSRLGALPLSIGESGATLGTGFNGFQLLGLEGPSSFPTLALLVRSAIAIVVVAVFQGILGILNYRRNFGEAPIPRIPSHGIVVVHPEDSLQIAPEESLKILRKASNQDVLRLLVIGDSLAVGVGQSQSCTQIMPEVIAKTISKKLGGRAVFWTCHGEPGASVGWLVRELECGVKYRTFEDHVNDSSPISGTIKSDDIVVSGMINSEDTANVTPWKQLLEHHRNQFDPEFLEPYDITVVLTGPNDIKSAFFPFLLLGEDIELRQQARRRGGNFDNELQRLIEALNLKVRNEFQGLRKTMSNATETVRVSLGSVASSMRSSSETSMGSIDSVQVKRSDSDLFYDHAPILPFEERVNVCFPIVVLPGMPARALPALRDIPLRWLTVPVLDLMDSHKHRLATKRPAEVLFIASPPVQQIDQYVQHEGSIWAENQREATILALREISSTDCDFIQQSMKHFYGESSKCSAHVPKRRLTMFATNYPREDAFSADTIHPNELGYDFWGRVIGNGIYSSINETLRNNF